MRVTLANGKKRTAKRLTRPQAEAALMELLERYRSELSPTYRDVPLWYWRQLHDAPRPPRSGVTKRVRWLVLERDDFRCRYCHTADIPLVIDHVKPVADGGTDDIDNLAAACVDCNAGKGARSLIAPSA